jgi:hypothetical protein
MLNKNRIVNEIDLICRRKFLGTLLATGALAGCAGRPANADPSSTVGLSRAAALAAVVPMPDDSTVQTIYLDWHDTHRDRPVAAKLYLPAQTAIGTAGAQKLPLLVVSHGLGGSREGYSYLGKYLAQHGYACLHLQHVGSDRSLWSGNVLGLVSRLQTAPRKAKPSTGCRTCGSVWTASWTVPWANTSILGKSWLQGILMVPTPACWPAAQQCSEAMQQGCNKFSTETPASRQP